MKIGSILLAASLLLTGCGLQKAVDSAGETAGKMDDTLAEMKNLNNKQCKAITFQDLLDPKFGQDLAPVPFDLMPFAKEFAECTPVADIVEVMYLWMKKANELTMPPTASAPTADQQMAFNLHLMQVFSAMESVAGFLPEAKVDQIVAEQIDNDGRFQDTALQILMLRVRFMRDVMLEASLLSKPLNNVGKVQKAIEYANAIEKISRLPFARPALKTDAQTGSLVAAPSPIAMTFTGPLADMTESLDRDLALNTWVKIRSKIAKCFSDPTMPETCSPIGVHDKLSKKAQGQLDQSQRYINQKILGWGGTLD